MKKQSFYPLKRFLSLLILDKDIVKEKLEEKIMPTKESTIHPLFLQVREPEDVSLSIQPDELGGIEAIHTHVFSEEDENIPILDYEEEEDENIPITAVTPEISTSISSSEEDFYDYAVSDIPTSVLSEESPAMEEPIRKADKLVSLRDVLIERGNFWQDKSKKVENIWERDPNMPEEEMIIHDDMVVGDVLFDAGPELGISKEEVLEPIQETKKSTHKETHQDRETATLLGISEDGQNIVSIEQSSLRRHTLIVGQTGSGKSTLMERMILQDIDAGRGVGLIDPHGDLYDRIIHHIPKSRSNDVVLFDLADIDYPIGFNILENTHEQFPSLVASSIVGVFKKIFGYSW